jgi:hypothetical protein
MTEVNRTYEWYERAFSYLMKKGGFKCTPIGGPSCGAIISLGGDVVGSYYVIDVVRVGWPLKDEPNQNAFRIQLERGLKGGVDALKDMILNRKKLLTLRP